MYVVAFINDIKSQKNNERRFMQDHWWFFDFSITYNSLSTRQTHLGVIIYIQKNVYVIWFFEN